MTDSNYAAAVRLGVISTSRSGTIATGRFTPSEPSLVIQPGDEDDPEGQVSQTGDMIGTTQVAISSIDMGDAGIAVSTIVTVGTPWRVTARVTGSYSSAYEGNKSLPVGAGCTGAILEKDCAWGLWITDLECYYPNGGTGYVHASTVHVASFASGPVERKSADRETCGLRTTCNNRDATNYGGELPCTYPVPGEGETSTPPSSYEPAEPPAPVYPVYFEPMPGGWNCNIWNPDADYPTEKCIWVEYNDAKLPTTSGQLALSRTAANSEFWSSASQDVNTKPFASVFVIVSDSMPQDAMAVVERRTKGPYKNVILVPSSTIRPAVLAAAMRFLYDSRAKHGETPAVQRFSQLRGQILDQSVPLATRDVAVPFATLLAAAERRDMGRYGRRQVLVLRMLDIEASRRP